MENYADGSIVSLKLENFQIFETQELEFGPQLNLIAAPNGSGKSTVANAIAFLFNGGPKTIGKSKDITDYITFGKSRASIFGVIAYKGETVSIGRVLDKNGKKNTYFINGLEVPHKEYNSLISNFNVDVNNLCTFLPQERVSEFARMSGPELLLEALENSGISLERLYALQKELNTIDQALNSTEKKKIMVEKSVNMMSLEMEKVKEREENLERLERLEYKKYFIKYMKLKSEYQGLKSSKNELEKKIQEHENTMKNAELRISELKGDKSMTEYNSSVESVREQNGEIRRLYVEMDKVSRAIERYDAEINRMRGKEKENEQLVEVKIREIKEKSLALKAIEEKFEKSCKDFIAKILDFTRNTDDIPSDHPVLEFESPIMTMADIDSHFKKLLQKDPSNDKPYGRLALGGSKADGEGFGNIKDSFSMNGQNPSIPFEFTVKGIEKYAPNPRMYDSKIQKYQESIRQIQFSSSALERRMDELQGIKVNHQNLETRRMEQLKKYHPDTHKGVEWLRLNRDKFTEEVVEPAFLHISITPEYVSEVESVLNFQALSSFLVRNSRDFSTLTRLLKDQNNLSINVAEISHKSSSNDFSGNKFSNEARHSFDDLVCGVKRTELKRLGIDGVITDFIQAREEYISFFNSYYHLNSILVSKSDVNESEIFRSFNGIKKIVAAGRYIEFKKSRYSEDFIILSNRIVAKRLFETQKIEIETINSELENLALERDRNRKHLDQLLAEKAVFDEKKKSIKIEFDTIPITKIFYSLQNEYKNILFIEEELKKAREKNFKILIQDLSEKKENEKLAFNALLSQLTEILNISNFPAVDVEKIKTLLLDIQNEERSLIMSRHCISGDQGALKEAEDSIDSIKKQLEHFKGMIKSMKHQTNLDDLPISPCEIESEIAYLKAKLDVSVDKSDVKKEYNKKVTSLGLLNDEFNDLVSGRDFLNEDIEKEKAELNKKMEAFLEPVSKKFSELFSHFGYSGSILLDSSEQEWALNIMVKFREGDGLQKLTGFRQSGGEKSLSTILFLLSLQQSYFSPFRLVDEINQGMDSHNERIVFKILKDMSDTSQFFIITPKLIEDLEFGENVNTIIIFSGNGLPESF